MYAIILNNKIFAACQTPTDVAAYQADYPNCLVADAPENFVAHEYIFDGGVVRRKTEAELYQEAALADVHSSRAIAYPPITDYLDGVVKGDQAQIDAYVAACLAVKAKYPKEQP